MTGHVVFAVQAGDVLRVYVRNGDAELRQVAQSAVHTEVDPGRLVTLVADLDDQFGWTGPFATAGAAAFRRPAVAAPLPPGTDSERRAQQLATDRERKRRARRAASRGGHKGPTPGSRKQGEERRERLMALVRELHPKPVAAADFAPILLPGESNTGALHMSLTQLIDKGQLVRTGATGQYRWKLPPGVQPVEQSEGTPS